MFEDLLGGGTARVLGVLLDQALEDGLVGEAEVADIDATMRLEVIAGFGALAGLELFLDRLKRDLGHVAAAFETTVFIEHVGHATGHAGSKVAAGLAEHDDGTAGHVLAAVVAHAFDHRRGAGVTHSEALATHAGEEGFALDRAVEHGVADDDVLGGVAAELVIRAHDDAPAGQALADIVVAFAHQFERHATGQEGAEALAGRAGQLDLDGAVRQAGMAVLGRDRAGEHGADGAVQVAHRQVDGHRLTALQRRGRQREELLVERLVEAVVLAFGVVTADRGRHVRTVEDAAVVEAARLPVADTLLHVEQVGATDEVVELADAQLGHQLAHFVGDEEEEVDHVLGLAGKALAQLGILRGRIRVQADGQMKTGRDVVIGALLGADEFGFATAPLVVEGCIMMRKCHLNTCPVGVATQDPVLRAKFAGKPEHVVNYFFFVAEEVRQIMAQLGIRKFDDLVGRADLLDTRAGIAHWKAKGLDFSRLFFQPEVPADVPRRHVDVQDHGLDKALDVKLIEKSRAAIDKGEKVSFMEAARNVNRTVGAMLSGEVTRHHPEGLPDDTLRIQLEGTGGQSFGAFLTNGITLYLIGDANDYTGKGLSGGRVVVRPSIEFRGDAAKNIIVGNTVLYGATRGEAFFRGVAGERFAVRLSGATAVVEGTGDHGCEYMTGGTVAVLGLTGRNFAAGMSGGVAYVYDEDGQFAKRCNTAMVTLETVVTSAEQEATVDRATWHRGQTDEAQLRKLLEDHNRWTGSTKAREILDNWAQTRAKFVKVFPTEYKRALAEIHAKAAAPKAAATV